MNYHQGLHQAYTTDSFLCSYQSSFSGNQDIRIVNAFPIIHTQAGHD